jgi:hypothetical protein
VVHPLEVYEAALELGRIGMDPSWIAREVRVPGATVRGWLLRGRQGRQPEPPRPLPQRPYAYLLGLYLGDGHIARGGHGQHVLSIACDSAYPRIIDAASAAVRAVVPGAGVTLRHHPRHRCTRVVCVSRWWPVLFPQHGPGRKHDRPIVLTPWQRAVAAAEAQALVRGLIHSDGCRFVAAQRVGGKTYRYSRYAFSNRSDDIRAIFCEHLDLLGIGWTRPSAFQIAIDRRTEVAKLDVFVGPKR